MLDTIAPVSEKRIAVRVTKDCLRQLRGGHRWVYDQSINQLSHQGKPGDLAVIFDDKRQFFAIGLYDPASPIRVRVLHQGKPTQIDGSFWRGQITAALALRHQLTQDERTNAYRVINGENDAMPGLILDKYGSTYVLKLYTTAWLPHLAEVTEAIRELTDAQTLILRFSRNTSNQNRFGLREGDALFGSAPTEPVKFLEHGLHFEADVIEGQKTGHFLDQRDNRIKVSMRAEKARVLDVFSCNGGFSLHAAAGGAKEVISVDLNEKALANATANFALNKDHPLVSKCKHSVMCGDAFQIMQQLRHKKQPFNMVIVDPPSFAQRKSQIEAGLGAYAKLTKAAIALLAPGGTLVQASCSSFIDSYQFNETVLAAAGETGRKLSAITYSGHGIDHPSTFKESNYLKAIFATVA